MNNSDLTSSALPRNEIVPFHANGGVLLDSGNVCACARAHVPCVHEAAHILIPSVTVMWVITMHFPSRKAALIRPIWV